jgi:Arc/MetJ family transcription regulator
MRQINGSNLKNHRFEDNPPAFGIYAVFVVFNVAMAKYPVDLHEEALNAARAELGTATIKETVNEALKRATQDRGRRVTDALDILANADLDDRVKAWRRGVSTPPGSARTPSTTGSAPLRRSPDRAGGEKGWPTLVDWGNGKF